jgi:uncharacterized protein with von Willebrand factor type A (vWA) domain
VDAAATRGLAAFEWINPMPEAGWVFSQSVAMIAGIFEGAMYPTTLAGREAGTRSLAR